MHQNMFKSVSLAYFLRPEECVEGQRGFRRDGAGFCRHGKVLAEIFQTRQLPIDGQQSVVRHHDRFCFLC